MDSSNQTANTATDIASAAEGSRMQPMHSVPSVASKQSSLPAKHPFFKQGHVSMGPISSPTDQLMSPATQKIEAKRKHLLMNIKPKFFGDKLKEAADAPQ
ncbi:hypothetical protein HDU78_004065 [Chytriomyces hyalinus]|uniref:Uncharacterized protein n=1 Tax=Chytriomyces confervae TaxID=246404 RepID=A0A507EU62_9FUNG|nr:hypothetical protein BJ741DRAFT_713485 [Chytriomyces cf. hyalinus JEL632]KAJ3237506.1 hypothetical protein HDU78_004065 [Chytriomyces hyalinus]KAJ3397058.1 hypothetical protein HDU80_009701 [Chytriomyces hyalinus]TPX66776.1 hypothetical protein CcCBS67573_g07712 [Chytriomyces confervae]